MSVFLHSHSQSDHARAVEYYWRALQLDPSYASAWTLMGHENIELRNASAAIQCYRRALHLNGKDFRAWYGLGQAYEIMQMWSFALYYFRRAVTFRPYDPRMWCAVAECYERLSRPKDALTCYLRAEANEVRPDFLTPRFPGFVRTALDVRSALFSRHFLFSLLFRSIPSQDRERIAAIKAARLYAAQGDVGQACVFFKRVSFPSFFLLFSPLLCVMEFLIDMPSHSSCSPSPHRSPSARCRLWSGAQRLSTRLTPTSLTLGSSSRGSPCSRASTSRPRSMSRFSSRQAGKSRTRPAICSQKSGRRHLPLLRLTPQERPTRAAGRRLEASRRPQ